MSRRRIGKLFDETNTHGFEVDWLINNAGFGSMGDFADLDIDQERNMIELNISSLVALRTHIYHGNARAEKRQDH
ncbi:MAG: SDR family NAD(P)-dependent oxidoreductase [Chloracidobacterium sp.]|nr:SDR family NAD(P)-dependent oxidoreductase [Chloracidobacterium sp.]